MDRIPHRLVMNRVEKKVKCKGTLALVRKYLEAGYMDAGQRYKPRCGLPQGGELSPVLRNIVLHELDIYMERLKERFDKRENRVQTIEYERVGGQQRVCHKEKSSSGPSRASGHAEDRVGIMRYYRKGGDRLKAERKMGDGKLSVKKMDVRYKKLMYIRYADEILVLVRGSRKEAEMIKKELKNALRILCEAELDEEKTVITNSGK